jgi:hypothetical protein
MVAFGRGVEIDPEEHQSPCSIISHATRVMIEDMWNDDRIPPFLTQRCHKLALSAHHSPLLVGPEINRERAHCTNYEAALYDCRDIASALYEHRVLLRSRIGVGGETWDFEKSSMHRRRSRSGSRSSVGSRSASLSGSLDGWRRPSRERSRRRSRSRRRDGNRHSLYDRSRSRSRSGDRMRKFLKNFVVGVSLGLRE